MFGKVLVGVDGQPGGRDAIALATRLLEPSGELTLAHIHGGETFYGVKLDGQRERSMRLLEDERGRSGCSARLQSRAASSVGRGLHELAEELGVDLLVVGSCSRGLMGRVFVGNAARGALVGAPCAVASAPRGYAERPSEIAAVGVGYDGSSESEAALAAARALAAAHNAKLRALTAVSVPAFVYPGYVPPEIGEGIDVMLREASDRLDALDGVEGRAVYGLAGEQLAAFGREVDLLVVGSRSYGPVSRLILGSTSEHLQRNSPCPLLVLPRQAAQPPAAHAGEAESAGEAEPAVGAQGRSSIAP